MLVQDKRFAVRDKCYVVEVILKPLRVFGVNRNHHARFQRCRQLLQILNRRVSARMGVDKVDCRVAAVGGDLVTAVVVCVLSVEIAEPLRVDDVDRGCGVLERIDEAKAGHLAEVEESFRSCL